MLLADYLATHIVNGVFTTPGQYTSLETLLGIIGYAVQIYCDFSAYADIAIGISLLLGFELPDNFNAPYTAISVQDFWRRWHMTLSRWLRDYLYIPLGGNRKGQTRTYVNIMITMVLGGLWHGAGLALHLLGLPARRGAGRRAPARRFVRSARAAAPARRPAGPPRRPRSTRGPGAAACGRASACSPSSPSPGCSSAPPRSERR